MTGFAPWVATLGGVGLLRPMPGTLGSLAALPPAFLVMWFAGPWAVLAASFILLLVGFASVRHVAGAMEAGADPDRADIVIDEACGQFLALTPAMLSPVLWILSFALFRLFDIWKPGPIRLIERRFRGAWGVMLDDVAAGAAAAACVWAFSLTGWTDV
ncbi:MAG: phosphatidylglycerophosphatase A [bacterium]|nr:phosphatidylglycerophosphatase A [bacterium]MDE0416836.1 phosphatidylglycerophosphatase A [bacterium]